MREAASPSESRRPNTSYNSDTKSIPYGSGGVARERVRIDTRFSTFLADEGASLARQLEQQAAAFADVHEVEWHEGLWDNTTKWHEVAPDDHKDKRVYKAHLYNDNKGRPRRRVKTQPYPSGDTETFNDREIIDEEYQRWCADRLEEAGRLSDAERQHLEAERQARREAQRQEQEQQEAERKLKRQEDERQAKEKADLVAQSLAVAITRLLSLPQATSHPYFWAKGLEGHIWSDVRLDGRNLAIVVRDVLTDEIVGIQYVSSDGRKWFETGSRKTGACTWLTGIPPASARRFAEAEGWASAASCALAFAGDKPKTYVVAAIDAGNLASVYRLIKQRWPHARVLLASDDDANPLTKNGKPKVNVGQIKAHTLAFITGSKVAVPSIAGRGGTNVNFNDVHCACGVATVRLQLRTARDPNPTFGLPGMSGRNLRRAHDLAQKYGCTISVSPNRYLEAVDFQPGITALMGGMGTNKTGATAQWLAHHGHVSVCAVSHRQGLSGTNAKRLVVTDYRDIPNGFERTQDRAAYCLNSLWKLVDSRSGSIQTPDVVFLDEIRQLLSRLTSRGKFERKRQCLDVLEYIVRRARYVIVADAHLDRTTLRWLRRLRPDDTPHLVLSAHQPGSDRTIYQHERPGDVRAVARDALKAGKPVYYALNGLKRAYEVSGWLQELKDDLPGLRVLLICSDTSGEEAVTAFFRDPEGESFKYDLIVASPSVSTGVSIDGGHFQVVCGEFTVRVGTPNDALQALARVRDAQELHVWVDPRRAANVTDREIIRAGFWREPGDDAGMSTGVDPQTGFLTIEASYAELYLDVKVDDAYAVNAYARRFWEYVMEDGFTVRYGNKAEDAEEIERHAAEAAKANHKAGLLAAPDLTETGFRDLRVAQRALTAEERAALERYDLVDFYRLAFPDTELPDVINLDRNGDFRWQITNLELACVSKEAVRNMMKQQQNADKFKPDIIRYDHRNDAYRTTLTAARLNLKTLEVEGGRYDNDDLHEHWIRPLESQWPIYCQTVPGWPTLKKAKEQPMKALGGVLRGVFGLTHRRAGKASAGRYTLSTNPLEARRPWIERRKEGTDTALNLSFTSASVPAPPTTFEVLPHPERDPAAYLGYLLKIGRLESLGPKKTAMVRQKIAEADVGWLATLARSAPLQRVLGWSRDHLCRRPHAADPRGDPATGRPQ